MTKFEAWCDGPNASAVNGHELIVLKCVDGEVGVSEVAAAIPDLYVPAEHLSRILERRGKHAAAEYLSQKLPASLRGRSGDMGEILGTAYVVEIRGFTAGLSRLLSRDHREMAMRGDDILAVQLDADGQIKFAKGEAKSRVSSSASVISEAREGLDTYDGLPSPHALSQLSDRLRLSGRLDLSDAIDDAQIDDGIRPGDVTHVMFIFSGNDPSSHLRTDLNSYPGGITQHSVALITEDHQGFIAAAFAEAIENAA